MCKTIQFVLGILILIQPLIQAEEAVDPFMPFEWSDGQVSGHYEPKVAVYVPVEIEGDTRLFYLQMDTGCESSFLYGDRLSQYGLRIDSGAADVPVIWYAKGDGFGVDRFPIWWREEDNQSSDSSTSGPMLIGTLGSNVMQGRILILDFPQQAFAVQLDLDSVPANVSLPKEFIPATIVGGRFMITVRLGDDSLSNVMYDTGASSFGLLLSHEDWTRYTGYTGDEPEVIHDSVPSWGVMIGHWRAPSRFPLFVGGLQIDNPILDKVAWPSGGEDDLRLLGNAVFYDNYTVWLDFKNGQLGFIQSSQD